MDPGSRGREVAAVVPWRRAVGTWMLIMLAETAHGAAREIFIAPVIGALRARQLGVLLGSLIVLLIAWGFARWMNLPDRRSQLLVGGLWVLLTVAFEVAVGRAMDSNWARILSDYNPAQGGFMALGLAVLFAAPWLTRQR